jgi:F0F1-type ATP synthase assembly protein I
MTGTGQRGGGLSTGEFAGVGLQFALVILAFTFAGIWLDRKLGTSPWLLIICVFAGAGGGFYSIYQKAIAAQRRDAELKARRQTERNQQKKQDPR